MDTTTVNRVPAHTAPFVNASIREETERRIASFEERLDDIERRLAELDREWDIERTLEANASTLALIGIALGATVDRRWLALPAVVTGFLLQHAIQGWCPPVPLLRRLGVRTSREIDHERYALKCLRGDFRETKTSGSTSAMRARQALEAAEK